MIVLFFIELSFFKFKSLAFFGEIREGKDVGKWGGKYCLGTCFGFLSSQSCREIKSWILCFESYIFLLQNKEGDFSPQMNRIFTDWFLFLGIEKIGPEMFSDCLSRSSKATEV